MCKNVSLSAVKSVVAQCCNFGTTYFENGRPVSFSPYWDDVCGQSSHGNGGVVVRNVLLSTLLPLDFCLAAGVGIGVFLYRKCSRGRRH